MKNSIKRVQSESSLSALLSARILRKAKLRLTLLAAIPLLMGLTSCQQEEDFAPLGGEKELRCATRSTAAEGTTETFTRDFTLDLWSNDNPNKYERHAMHHDGTSWNVVKTNNLYDNTVAFAITGKGMNMDTNADKNQYFLSVYDQQETSLNVDDFDVMYAYNPNVDTETPLNLEFKHLFTKLTINIEYGSEFTTTPKVEYVLFVSEPLKPVVTITGIGTDNLQFDYAEDWIHPSKFINYGDEADMTDDKVEVIVGIGTLPAGYEFIHLYDRFGTTEPWKKVLVPEGGLTFEAGKHYTFDLKVGKDKVTIEKTAIGNDIPGWDNDSEEDLN